MAAVWAATAAVRTDALPTGGGLWLVSVRPGLVLCNRRAVWLIGLLCRPVRLTGPALDKISVFLQASTDVGMSSSAGHNAGLTHGCFEIDSIIRSMLGLWHYAQASLAENTCMDGFPEDHLQMMSSLATCCGFPLHCLR